jgi:hypothetical protein
LSGFVASGNAASVSRPAEAVTASRAKPNDHERQGEADTYTDTNHYHGSREPICPSRRLLR